MPVTLPHDDLVALQARIRTIQGGGTALGRDVARLGPALDACLPWGGLPVAALHEVGGSAATAVTAGMARRFLERPGVLVWCRSDRSARREGELYGPGLARFGIAPDRLLIVRARNAAEALWAAAEALRSPAAACTVLELEGLELKESRRLQLAAEAGGGAGLLLRAGSWDAAPNAALTRFRAEPLLPAPGSAAGTSVRLALWRAKGAAPAIWKVTWNDTTLAFDLVPALADRADGDGGPPPRDEAAA